MRAMERVVCKWSPPGLGWLSGWLAACWLLGLSARMYRYGGMVTALSLARSDSLAVSQSGL